MQHTFDARLREVPSDPAELERRVERLIVEIAAARSQPAQLLGMLLSAAPLFLMAGRIGEAQRTIAAAIAIGELLEDSHAVFVGQLLLAKALRHESRHDLATPLFDRLIAQARSVGEFSRHLDKALFEAGANLFEQARYMEAARFFRESQALRRRHGTNAELGAVAQALRLTAERSRANPATS